MALPGRYELLEGRPCQRYPLVPCRVPASAFGWTLKTEEEKQIGDLGLATFRILDTVVR